MESLLNILWVLTAVAGLCVWRLRWLRQEGISERTPAQEWTAMIAALVLLFFAVSLTDDLHSELLLNDEGATARRCSLVSSCGHAATHGANAIHVANAAIMPEPVTIVRPLLCARIATIERIPAFEGVFDSSSGRAPPAPSL
jgi:hypothetical protein